MSVRKAAQVVIDEWNCDIVRRDIDGACEDLEEALANEPDWQKLARDFYKAVNDSPLGDELNAIMVTGALREALEQHDGQ